MKISSWRDKARRSDCASALKGCKDPSGDVQLQGAINSGGPKNPFTSDSFPFSQTRYYTKNRFFFFTIALYSFLEKHGYITKQGFLFYKIQIFTDSWTFFHKL